MGQYFRPVIGNFNGYNFNVYSDGPAKLMEQAWIDNDVVNFVAKKLYHCPNRVMWVGDYAEEDEMPRITSAYTPETDEVWGQFAIPQHTKYTDFSVRDKILVNHTLKQFISMKEYVVNSIDKQGWIIHPLPLLTAVGNDKGSGDFHNGNIGYGRVGTWAWHVISVEDTPPEGYIQIVGITFKEELDTNWQPTVGSRFYWVKLEPPFTVTIELSVMTESTLKEIQEQVEKYELVGNVGNVFPTYEQAYFFAQKINNVLHTHIIT